MVFGRNQKVELCHKSLTESTLTNRKSTGTAHAKRNGMKIYFQIQPVSSHLHGWQRFRGIMQHCASATLVIEMAHKAGR